MRWIILALFAATTAQADPVTDVTSAASQSFAQMPPVVRVDKIADRCGADDSVNDQAVYCTSTNQILVADAVWDRPEAPYLVAHLYGHAVQVRHGVADFALAQIRSRRDEEQMLRGLVERQVDCIAGFLVARAGVPAASLTDWFTTDPFAGVHWGRDPLRVGPEISVPLAARDEWFQRGQGGDLAVCGPGEFTAGLLLDALRG